jgi:anti-anti-sigma factor
MLADVTIETVNGVPVARITGEVDASNARDVGARISDSVPNTAMGLVLDLSETGYLDSSGVQMLFEVADGLRRRQQGLRLVVPPESFVGDVLEAVKLGEIAGRDPSVPEAVRVLAPS